MEAHAFQEALGNIVNRVICAADDGAALRWTIDFDEILGQLQEQMGEHGSENVVDEAHETQLGRRGNPNPLFLAGGVAIQNFIHAAVNLGPNHQPLAVAFRIGAEIDDNSVRPEGSLGQLPRSFREFFDAVTHAELTYFL
jgi:hypothetical protein